MSIWGYIAGLLRELLDTSLVAILSNAMMRNVARRLTRNLLRNLIHGLRLICVHRSLLYDFLMLLLTAALPVLYVTRH